jgi:hypothetical protein
MGQEQFDILVIGGGITGAGIASHAARRGYTVALVEKGDFASGTSSKTSKLVHGGLRYLATGDLALVAQACRQRRTLLRLAPHLVWPLPFVLPVYAGGRSPWQIGAAMWLYDALAAFQNTRRHQVWPPARALLQGMLDAVRRGLVRLEDVRISALRLGSGNLVPKHFGLPREPRACMARIAADLAAGRAQLCCVYRCTFYRRSGEASPIYGLTMGGLGQFGRVPSDIKRWRDRHPRLMQRLRVRPSPADRAAAQGQLGAGHAAGSEGWRQLGAGHADPHPGVGPRSRRPAWAQTTPGGA